MLQTKLKFIKNVLYKLERSYGLPGELQKIDQHSVDPQTGEKTTVLSSINIPRIIILRAREFRSFVYDLAYISANKDFTTGGFFDPEDRRAIVRANYLNNYEPQVGDFIIFQGERYNIKEVHHFENNYCYGFLLRKLKGQPLIDFEQGHSGLILTESLTHTIQDKLNRDVSSVLNLTHDLEETP